MAWVRPHSTWVLQPTLSLSFRTKRSVMASSLDESTDSTWQWVQRRLKYVEMQIETLPHKFVCALDDREESVNRNIVAMLEKMNRRLDAIEAQMTSLPDDIEQRIQATVAQHDGHKASNVDSAAQTMHPMFANNMVTTSVFGHQHPMLQPSPPLIFPPTPVNGLSSEDEEDSIDLYWANAAKENQRNGGENASQQGVEDVQSNVNWLADNQSEQGTVDTILRHEESLLAMKMDAATLNPVQDLSNESLEGDAAAILPTSPLTWRFPVTRCDILWRHWFYGDGVKGPFRYFRGDDHNAMLHFQAQTVIDKLLETAIAAGLVSGIDDLVKKPPAEFMAIFHTAFNEIVTKCESKSKVAASAWTFMQLFDEIDRLAREEETKNGSYAPPSFVRTIDKSPQQQSLPSPHTFEEVKAPPPIQSTPSERLEDIKAAKSVRFEDNASATSSTSSMSIAAPSPTFEKSARMPSTPEDDDRTMSNVSSSITEDSVDMERPITGDFYHVWSDGANRRAPEGWRWPSVSCREMWILWFRGDPDNEVGPFRNLEPADMCGTSKDIYCYSKIAMDKLIDIALANLFVQTKSVLEELNEDELLSVFDQAYDVLLHHNPDGNLVGPNRDQLRPENASSFGARTIGHRISKLHTSRRAELSYQWSDNVIRRTSPGWIFPVTTCKAMWILWFRGDTRAHVGPFYDLREVDVPHIQSRAELLRARYVMTTLIEIAVQNKCAPSVGVIEQMPLAVLLDVFAMAFSIMANQIPDDHRAGDNSGDWKDGTVLCQRVYTAYQNRRRPRVDM
ncbi:unnamed protein product [Aphanomyces euteiches]